VRKQKSLATLRRIWQFNFQIETIEHMREVIVDPASKPSSLPSFGKEL